jgi:ribosomal protein S18 acetylase RimI-like enzyme
VRAARRARGAEFPDPLEQVVVYDGDAVGALLTARTDGVLHLVDIALLPGFRDRGIGTVVLEHVLTDADRERRTVRALVYRSNPRAHALYRRLGFRDVAADQLTFTIERSPV